MLAAIVCAAALERDTAADGAAFPAITHVAGYMASVDSTRLTLLVALWRFGDSNESFNHVP